MVVDDSEDDVIELTRSLQLAGILNPVFSVPSGRELIRYITGQAKYFDRAKFPLPGLIFLDVRMPEMDGFQVLDWLRQNKSLESIPVVVLTGSMPLSEATRAYQMGAVSFLSKPPTAEFVKLLPDAALKSLQFDTRRC